MPQHPLEPDPAELLALYARGLFPMADPETGRLGWFDADPRGVLPIGVDFHVSARLARTRRSGRFRLTTGRAFPAVLYACANPARAGAWIDNAVALIAITLHNAGHAHSVEAWRPIEDIPGHERGLPLIEPGLGGVQEIDGELCALVGGLYGVACGAAFFAESMFHRADLGGTDAGKCALAHLHDILWAHDFTLFDTQMCTNATASFGCEEIPRDDFARRLERAVATRPRWPTRRRALP